MHGSIGHLFWTLSRNSWYNIDGMWTSTRGPSPVSACEQRRGGKKLDVPVDVITGWPPNCIREGRTRNAPRYKNYRAPRTNSTCAKNYTFCWDKKAERIGLQSAIRPVHFTITACPKSAIRNLHSSMGLYVALSNIRHAIRTSPIADGVSNDNRNSIVRV